MKFRKMILVFLIISSVLLYSGCSNLDIESIKSNQSATMDYNNLIKFYNKTVLDFTKLAGDINSELMENNNLNKLDLKKYESQKVKVYNNIYQLMLHSRYFREDPAFLEEIEIIISEINKYLSHIDNEIEMRETKVNIDEINKIYDDIYESSIVIVNNIDKIYENMQQANNSDH